MVFTEKFFSAFKLAINEEQKAYELYISLAEMCDESELKKLFEKFAADELQHKNILMERYKEMKKAESLTEPM
jgi:rubrerythrin